MKTDKLSFFGFGTRLENGHTIKINSDVLYSKLSELMQKSTKLILFAAIVSSVCTAGVLKISEKSFTEKSIAKELPYGHFTSFAAKQALAPPTDFTFAAEKSTPAVVHIKSTIVNKPSEQRGRRNGNDPFRDFFGDEYFNPYGGPQQGQSSGSGVIISAEGYIVTNNHVVENADEIEVTLQDKRTFKARVVGTDPSTDLAILEIKATNLPFLTFANSDEVRVGEWVLAVGNPFNLESTVTAGIVSAKGRNINILKDNYAIESFIQTDAAVNPGNSGGALVNLNGDLIGINTAIASPNGAFAGYSFAIPSSIVKKISDDIIKYGSAQRGFLGVIIRSVDGNLAKDKKLDVNQGVYVDSLVEKGSARDAGIKKGDVITKVDGVEVKSSPNLQELIGRHRPGESVLISINRGGKLMDITVPLKSKEGKTAIAKKEEGDILAVLGVELKEATKEECIKAGIDSGVLVVKIEGGKIKKDTDMKEGFIITKFDGKEIKTVDNFKTLLKTKKGGVLLEGVYPDYPGTFYYAFGI